MRQREFSEGELILLEHFGFRKFAEEGLLAPIPIYRACYEKVFLEDMHGPAVEALRRVGRALNSEPPTYRGTPEFETLIQIHPNNEKESP